MYRTLLLLIEMMLKDACAENDDYPKYLPVWIQSSTFLAGAWAFGGALTTDSREQFDVFFRDIWKGNKEVSVLLVRGWQILTSKVFSLC